MSADLPQDYWNQVDNDNRRLSEQKANTPRQEPPPHSRTAEEAGCTAPRGDGYGLLNN